MSRRSRTSESAGFDVPDKGADADFLVAFVELSHCGEKLFNFVVVDDGEDGVVHFRPCVGAAVGVTIEVTPSLDVLPKGEAPYLQGVEHVFHAFVVGLVVYYEYRFHVVFVFNSSNSQNSPLSKNKLIQSDR